MADSFISNAIQYNHVNDVDILYAVVRNVTRQIRDVVNSEWDSHPSSGSLDDYDISAGVALGGLWNGDFPEIANGFYIIQIRKRTGATPDCSDEIVAADKGYWNDSIFGGFAVDVNGRVDVSEIKGVDATNQIRDAIINDETRFSGASIAAMLLNTDAIEQLLNADKVIDTSGSPWVLEYRHKDTKAVLLRQTMKNTAGETITSINNVLGQLSLEA